MKNTKILSIFIISGVGLYLLVLNTGNDESLNQIEKTQVLARQPANLSSTPPQQRNSNFVAAQNPLFKIHNLTQSSDFQKIPAREKSILRKQKSLKRYLEQIDMNQLETFLIKGTAYKIISELHPVPAKDYNSLDHGDALGIVGSYVVVKSESFLGTEGNLQTVYNKRTNRVEIITGRLIVTFKEDVSFEGFAQELGVDLQEQFPHIKTAFYYQDSKMSDLLATKNQVDEDGRVQTAELEILSDSFVTQ